MDADLKMALDPSFDALETAFSDESRKVVRHIKAEWQTITKYREAILVEEEELRSAKEKFMHLNEIKAENEKYLKATQSRIVNLKETNIQLKSKLSTLKKEGERATKKFSEEQEYMNKKLAFFEEKWRKRYEAHYSQNPKIEEKYQAFKELQEGKQKLFNLNNELQKYEEELFQAKCERNKRAAEESLFYPLSSFVVNIAKIYLETVAQFEECKQLSYEISVIDKNVAAQESEAQEELLAVDQNESAISNTLTKYIQCCNGNKKMESPSLQMERENHLTETEGKIPNVQKVQKWLERLKIYVPKFSDFSESEKPETKMNKRDVMPSTSRCIETINTLPTLQENHSKSFGDAEAMDIDSSNKEGVSSKQILQPIYDEQSKSFCEPEAMEIETSRKRDNFSLVKHTESMNETPSNINLKHKMSPQKSYFQCKMSTQLNDSTLQTLTEQQISSMKVSKYFQKRDTNLILNEHLTKTATEKFDTTKYFPQSKVSTQLNDSTLQTLTEQQIRSKNVSKYFQKGDTNSLFNEYLTKTATEKMDTTKSFLQESVTQQTCLETMDVDESLITYNQYSLNKTHEVDKFQAEGKKVEHNMQQRISQQTIAPYHQEENSTNSFLKIHCTSVKLTNISQNMENNFDETRYDSINISEEKPVQHFANRDTDKEILKEQQMSVISTISETEPEKQILAVESKPVIAVESTPVIAIESTPIIAVESTPVEKNFSMTLSNEQNSEKDLTTNTPNIEENYPINTSNSSPKDINNSGPSPAIEYYTPASALCTQNSGRSSESMSKTPVTNPAQTTTEAYAALDTLNVPPFNLENSKSPGFTYTTRLMYQAGVSNMGAVSQNMPTREMQNNQFNPTCYFNAENNTNIPSVQSSKSDEDKNESLASAYEAYFNDSPPMLQPGKEKNMFAIVDSPDTDDGPGGFFQLFAADNGQSDKESKDNKTPFMLNFGGPSTSKSPEDSTGFKFLF